MRHHIFKRNEKLITESVVKILQFLTCATTNLEEIATYLCTRKSTKKVYISLFKYELFLIAFICHKPSPNQNLSIAFFNAIMLVIRKFSMIENNRMNLCYMIMLKTEELFRTLQ